MLLHIDKVSNRFNLYQLLFSLLLRVVPEGEQQVRLSAAVQINALAETVWAVLLDCQQALEYIPDIRECEILDSGVDAQGLAYDVTMHRLKPYFFLPSVESIFRASYQKPLLIEFRKQRGDLESFMGNWRFEQEGENATVLHYQASVHLSKRLGQRNEMRILLRDIPDMLKKLRELAEPSSE